MSWKNDQVSAGETKRILELAESCLNVPGDYVEFGCYKGDTSLLLAELLVEKSVEKDADKMLKRCEEGAKSGGCGNIKKRLWIYDSFEGLPEKSDQDRSVLGVSFRCGELFVTKREVKERFLRANLPVPMIKKAWFRDLTEKDLPEKIAFAFLDGDFYESIRDSLRLVVPRMSEGGVMVIHDYSNPALPGVRRAVEEFGAMSGRFRVELL